MPTERSITIEQLRDRGRVPGARALRHELVDEVLDRARRGLEIGELPDEVREP